MLGGGIQKCLHWGFYWCAIVCLAAAALQEQHKPRSNVAEYEAPRVFCGQSTWTDDYVVIFLGAPGMELPRDGPSAYYKYPLRQSTDIFLVSEALHLTVEAHIPLPSTLLQSFFENSSCSESVSQRSSEQNASYQSYRFALEIRSTDSRDSASFHFVNFWNLNGPQDYATKFEYDMLLRPLTIDPFKIELYLERDVILQPSSSDNATFQHAHTQSIALLTATATLHVVHCDMQWLPLHAFSEPVEVGSLVLLSTNCTVPIPAIDSNDSDDAITFECHVTGAVAFNVYPYLDRKSVTILGSQRLAHHTYIVEIPIRSTGVHILKSHITYFNGHGQAELGSPKVSTHFPVSHLLQDYSLEPQQLTYTPTTHHPLPFCRWKDAFDTDIEVASFDAYWLNVETCSKLNLLPQDQQRCSSFETMCSRHDAVQPGNNGAASALKRLCASAWLFALPHCVWDLVLPPSHILSQPAHVNIARFSTRFDTVAFYGSSLQDMNTFAVMELMGVPLECLGDLAQDKSTLANCVFFSHATNSSASIYGDDPNAIMRVRKIASDRKFFSIASASNESSLKGLNISFSRYPAHCNGEAHFCAADNLPKLSRVWPPASGPEVDLGVNLLGQDIRYCSTSTCPLCVDWTACFQKHFADDIQHVTGDSPALILVEIPLVGRQSLFISNVNSMLHALADSLKYGSCVILVDGHGLHSNKDIDRRFPMRANVGSRTQSFDSIMWRIWHKSWSIHYGFCEDDTAHMRSVCSDDIDAAGLIRLLSVLGRDAAHGSSEDAELQKLTLTRLEAGALMPRKTVCITMRNPETSNSGWEMRLSSMLQRHL